MFFSPQEQDEYHPDHSHEEDGDGTKDNITGDWKFIIFESQLMLLFKRCHSCGLEMVELKTTTSATLSGICSDGHVLHWQSQPVVRRIPAGNLLLAAAILLSGQTFTSYANLADVLNLVMFGERRYYDLQREYVYPVVHTTYVRQKEAVAGFHHTGLLEVFHSLLLKYCPKRQHLWHDGM